MRHKTNNCYPTVIKTNSYETQYFLPSFPHYQLIITLNNAEKQFRIVGDNFPIIPCLESKQNLFWLTVVLYLAFTAITVNLPCRLFLFCVCLAIFLENRKYAGSASRTKFIPAENSKYQIWGLVSPLSRISSNSMYQFSPCHESLLDLCLYLFKRLFFVLTSGGLIFRGVFPRRKCCLSKQLRLIARHFGLGNFQDANTYVACCKKPDPLNVSPKFSVQPQ